MKAVHIKSGKTYIILDDAASVKINGEWQRAVIYKATYESSLQTFVRPFYNFQHKFIILDEPLTAVR